MKAESEHSCSILQVRRLNSKTSSSGRRWGVIPSASRSQSRSQSPSRSYQIPDNDELDLTPTRSGRDSTGLDPPSVTSWSRTSSAQSPQSPAQIDVSDISMQYNPMDNMDRKKNRNNVDFGLYYQPAGLLDMSKSEGYSDSFSSPKSQLKQVSDFSPFGSGYEESEKQRKANSQDASFSSDEYFSSAKDVYSRPEGQTEYPHRQKIGNPKYKQHSSYGLMYENTHEQHSSRTRHQSLRNATRLSEHEQFSLGNNVRWSDNLARPSSPKRKVVRPTSILRKKRGDNSVDNQSDDTPSRFEKVVRISEKRVDRGNFLSESPSATGFVDSSGRSLSPIQSLNDSQDGTFPSEQTFEDKWMTNRNSTFERNIPKEFQHAFWGDNKNVGGSGTASDAYGDFIEVVAAVVVQTAARQFLARRKVEKLRGSRHFGSNRSRKFGAQRTAPVQKRIDTSQRRVPVKFHLFDLAAVRIQSAFRGWWVRDQNSLKYYCATVIQKTFRMYLCRVYYNRWREREAAHKEVSVRDAEREERRRQTMSLKTHAWKKKSNDTPRGFSNGFTEEKKESSLEPNPFLAKRNSNNSTTRVRSIGGVNILKSERNVAEVNKTERKKLQKDERTREQLPGGGAKSLIAGWQKRESSVYRGTIPKPQERKESQETYKSKASNRENDVVQSFGSKTKVTGQPIPTTTTPVHVHSVEPTSNIDEIVKAQRQKRQKEQTREPLPARGAKQLIAAFQKRDSSDDRDNVPRRQETKKSAETYQSKATDRQNDIVQHSVGRVKNTEKQPSTTVKPVNLSSKIQQERVQPKAQFDFADKKNAAASNRRNRIMDSLGIGPSYDFDDESSDSDSSSASSTGNERNIESGFLPKDNGDVPFQATKASSQVEDRVQRHQIKYTPSESSYHGIMRAKRSDQEQRRVDKMHEVFSRVGLMSRASGIVSGYGGVDYPVMPVEEKTEEYSSMRQIPQQQYSSMKQIPQQQRTSDGSSSTNFKSSNPRTQPVPTQESSYTESTSSYYTAMRAKRSEEEQRRLDAMHEIFHRVGLMSRQKH